ncbi:MAG: hypothetical protein O2877_02270, partial [bacterium]|nr:hypothetical protein [bacterium]
KQTLFTNSPEKLLSYTHETNITSPETTCGNTGNLYIDLKPFISYLQFGSTHFSTAIPLSSSSFVHVGMHKGPFGTSIVLCNPEVVDIDA